MATSTRLARPTAATDTSSRPKAGAADKDAEALLREDHRKVNGLFKQFESAAGPQKKRELVRQICTELAVHARLEEEMFYPACREKNVEDALLDEAQVEHDCLKLFIGDLLGRDPASPFYDAKVAVLAEYVKHHVTEEEKAGSGIFAKARKENVDMAALGARLQQRKKELEQRAEGVGIMPSATRAFRAGASAHTSQTEEETEMPRSYDRDRDERGRFTDEDEGRGHYGQRGGGYSDRNWPGYDEGRRRGPQGPWREEGSYGASYGRGGRQGYGSDDYSRGRDYGAGDYGRPGGYRERDDYGRFRGGEDRGYSGRGGMSGLDEDDGNGSRGRGGFERERDEYGRFMSDDDRGSQHWRSRDDDYVHGGGPSRFGNRGDRDRDAMGRFTGDDDNGGSRGRGSRTSGGGSRSGGQGGWFGDPRGHSEAARKGWRDRD
jgi:hypothetical protein